VPAIVKSDFARQLERELGEANKLIERLRRDLLDPPADVQELVIQKLNLVAAESVDAWRKCADELARYLHLNTRVIENCMCGTCRAIAAYEKLKGER
jgi:hypothetical protein